MARFSRRSATKNLSFHKLNDLIDKRISRTATKWVLEDDDGTEVIVNNNKEVKYISGGGLSINLTDTSHGSDSDPYDMTLTVDPTDATAVNVAASDVILIGDASDSNSLKRAEVGYAWDGTSFYKKIENDEDIGRDFLILSQNAWSCQRTVRFENWTLIKTFHTGLKDFPEIVLFDFEKDFHMTKNLADEKPEIVEKGLNLLDKWHESMMSTSRFDIDPMSTVLNEGGPWHTRGYLEGYLKRLRDTGRMHLIEKIFSKNESY